MDYSPKTQALIERLCRYVERPNYVLNKKEAEEYILKTYNLFNLKRPSKIKWCIDIFDEEFIEIASLASSAMSALDEDFNWFVFEYEYCQNPDRNNLPNKHDFLHLEYCKLLLKALEYGLGYRIEWEDTLYLVPCPLVKIDAQNRFHSEHYPSINWSNGHVFYYLHGVNFSKDLWLKIINRQMSMQEVMQISDIDQRTQAIKYAKGGLREFYLSQNGKMIDHYVKMDKEGRPINYELWCIPQGEIFNKEVYFVIYDCPTARERGEKKEYSKGVPKFNTAAEAMAWGMSSDECVLPPEGWKKMIPLVDES